MTETNEKCMCFPYRGKAVAKVWTEQEKNNLKNWCYPAGSGIFTFAEGYKTLHGMFFYRREWLRCIVLPKSMRFVEKYACVPYVKVVDHKVISHKKSDYRYPSEWAALRINWGFYASKTEKIPISMVVKSPKTKFDPYAFGDGDGEDHIVFFLDFDSEYDVSNIKANITLYKKGEWKYVDGLPTPL